MQSNASLDCRERRKSPFVKSDFYELAPVTVGKKWGWELEEMPEVRSKELWRGLANLGETGQHTYRRRSRPPKTWWDQLRKVSIQACKIWRASLPWEPYDSTFQSFLTHCFQAWQHAVFKRGWVGLPLGGPVVKTPRSHWRKGAWVWSPMPWGKKKGGGRKRKMYWTE